MWCSCDVGAPKSTADAEPKLSNEAQRLLEEEQKLTEKEAQTSGREKAAVMHTNFSFLMDWLLDICIYGSLPAE